MSTELAGSNNSMPPELPPTGERLHTSEHGVSMLEHLHRYALARSLCQDRNVLDIACGEGYGSNLLAQASARVIGVDISADAISHAAAKYKRNNLCFVEGSADRIPLGAGVVDIVVSFETLEHHDRHLEMISETKRVLRPEGMLIISTPDKLHYTDLPNYLNPFHQKELYLEEFRGLLRSQFRNVGMLLQKVVYCSLISPETKAQGFTEYWGTYSNIGSSEMLEQQVYNICIASDAELPEAGLSIFDGSDMLAEDIDRRVLLYANSRSYRLGRALTWPLRRLLRKS
ncbi:MAG: class I SAM-dependent methyltransferase [Pyrinomonadaceae bacterium]|nr:class I SAM-dependent methyltransferase [Pyrinomonadaceae bacterium]